MEKQSCMSLHLQIDEWHTGVVAKLVSLYSFNLFYFILVTYMKQLDYCRIVRTKREELKKMYVISKNDRAGTQKCSLKKAFSKIS